MLAPAAVAQPASLRLHAPEPSVTLTSFRDRVPLELGISVASVGGDIRLHVTRPDYATRPAGRQVDAETGEVLRTIPAANLNGFRGLRRFFLLTIRKPGGKVVKTLYRQFCPNSYERERMDDSGPTAPYYPAECRAGSPFTRGLVWGIEGGWATSAFGANEDAGFRQATIPLKPGSYRVTVAITPFFRSLFGIAAEDAEATIALTVRAARRGFFAAPDGGTAGARAQAARDVPVVLDPDPETLPDLEALPAWSMFVDRRRRTDYLGFASTPWNAGPAPLVVEGFRRPGEARMDAFQYFSDEDGTVVGKAPVGTFDWDARRGHHHWHFLQFVRYAIVDAETNDVVRSRKQSFCLAPTDAIDVTGPRAALSPWSDELTSICGGRRSTWVREVLPAGWGDTYVQAVAGQAFNITSLPNGNYRVLVEVNPLGLVHEVTTENNVAFRDITLRGKKGNRRVETKPWNGIRH